MWSYNELDEKLVELYYDLKGEGLGGEDFDREWDDFAPKIFEAAEWTQEQYMDSAGLTDI